MEMSSGEEPCGGLDEDRCVGRSSYPMVSSLGRIAVAGSLASSSAIAASVSRPTGPRRSVISGCEASGTCLGCVERGADSGGRDTLAGGRDVLRPGERGSSGRNDRDRGGLPGLTANELPQIALSHEQPLRGNNWLRIGVG